MIKLRSAVEHRSIQASEFFNTEIYGVPACFAVNHTGKIYHGTESSKQDRFQTCELLNYNQNNLRELLLLRHHLCCANYQVFLLKLFMTSRVYSTNMLID